MKLVHIGTVLVFGCLLAAGPDDLVAAPTGTVVENGPQPRDGVTTAGLEEVWRAGGDDDEIFFGSVARVTTDGDGNIMILDGQLSEVHIFGPDGESMRTIGGEGEGPGETRRPSDMFVASDGVVHLLQGFPGRLVKLQPDGIPAGNTNYSTGEPGAGQFAVLIRGLPQPEGMVLAGISMSFGGGGQSQQNLFLAQCGPDGVQRRLLLNKSYTIDYNDFVIDELTMDFVWTRVTVGPAGHIYAAPEFHTYDIRVFDTNGDEVRSIKREYESPPRTERQTKQVQQVYAAIGTNYPTPPKRITTADKPPAVIDLWVTADNHLWVQTGDEQPGRPAGTWVRLDEFDAAGSFVRQVALPGDHDQSTDALYLLPDRRVVVVVGALGAFLNQQAVADESQSDADPLEIICYRLTD